MKVKKHKNSSTIIAQEAHMSLSAIRHQLVLAAQAEYDARIARGIHPYAMASYHFDDCISRRLRELVDTKGWKAGNWSELNRAYDASLYPHIVETRYGKEGPNSNGLWAVGAFLGSAAAYATPGFFEAYNNSIIANN